MSKQVFIGGGNMATAIIAGLINKGTVPADICVADPSSERLAVLAKQYAVRTVTDNHQALDAVDVLILAVKPQVMQQVCVSLASKVQEHKPLIISVAAGLPAELINGWLGGDLAVVRVMPNTPAMVGVGMTGLWANERVSAEQRQLAEDIFASVGEVLVVDDQQQLHDITAISGSGPAYFYLFMEAMTEQALAMGFDSRQAKRLVAQTALGAAQMVLTQGKPGDLKRNVMSPGGTTERAIALFEAQGLPKMVVDAMQACRDRSVELADVLTDRGA